MIAIDRQCVVCHEELDAMDSASVTHHLGCCEHENTEAALSPDGTTERRGEAWCADCGTTLVPSFDEFGFDGWVEGT
jgi:hypothetical protein